MLPRWGGAALALMLLVASCTPSPGDDAGEPARPVPEGARGAAEDLLAALEDGDRNALLEAASRRTVKRTLQALRRARRDALLESVRFEVTGDAVIDEGLLDPGSTAPFNGTVPYEVLWDSEPLEGEETLEGDIAVDYDESAEAWQASFDETILWPGVPGARGTKVTSKWPRRGRILDRQGRVLAAGRAESRRYPHGSLAGTTIGHIEPLTEAARADGVVGAPGDLVGGSGLEEAFQTKLGGSPRLRLVVTGSRGRTLRELASSEGSKGEDLRTTLDIDVQRAAEAGYRTTGGAVVLDPGTGDILAAVASSPFGPGNYVGAEGVEPFNRALSGLYPPGSSMKVVTAAAALDSKVVKPGSTVSGPEDYKGVRNFESGVFGSIPFSDAVRFSVNTAFAQVAEDLGSKRLTRYAEAFGFNQDPSTSFHAATSSFPRPEELYDLMWGSIGQAQVLATPLQMASVAATIANDGKRMEPRIDRDEPKRGVRVVSKKTAQALALLMEGAVRSGTGVNAQISGVRIAGKTGTAEVDVGDERRNHAWFVCFTPVGGAEVALAVVSEYGGVGGQVAAPIARSILTGILPHI